MLRNYAKQNLRKVSFKNANLTYTSFTGSDLRGADFTGADLSYADLTYVRTGITPLNTVILFLATLAVSAFSGYIAMLAGTTVQAMFASPDKLVRLAGAATIILVTFFIVYSWRKGVGRAIRQLIVPVCCIALLGGMMSYMAGAGTGRGMLYLVLACILVAAMFIVGAIARTVAGSLSNIIFIIVALTGGIFGRNVGGGIGTIIMALSCAVISKKALSGERGFESLQRIALFITRKFGTSFRGARLTHADFSHSKIKNADFTKADISNIHWGDAKRINSIGAKTQTPEQHA